MHAYIHTYIHTEDEALIRNEVAPSSSEAPDPCVAVGWCVRACVCVCMWCVYLYVTYICIYICILHIYVMYANMCVCVCLSMQTPADLHVSIQVSGEMGL